jgi:ABC-type glycerol-3-phosphate transport system substrate-binding protein
MKRVCLLVVAGALILAGCGGSSGSSSSAGSASGAKGGHVNITLWEGYTDGESNAMRAELKRLHGRLGVASPHRRGGGSSAAPGAA